MLGKRHYVKNIIAAGGFGLQWSSRRPESRCVSVGTLYVHVSPLTCSRLFPRRREGCREWEWGEREGGGRRKRKLCSPALWLCCKGGPAQSGGTTHSWTPRGPRGRKSAGLRHTPTSDVAQHTTDSESDSNWCSNTPHRLLIILPAVFSFTPWLMWADCRAPTLLLILLPPQHLPFLSSSSIPFFLLSRLFLPSPPPGTFLLCLLSKAPTS